MTMTPPENERDDWRDAVAQLDSIRNQFIDTIDGLSRTIERVRRRPTPEETVIGSLIHGTLDPLAQLYPGRSWTEIVGLSADEIELARRTLHLPNDLVGTWWAPDPDGRLGRAMTELIGLFPGSDSSAVFGAVEAATRLIVGFRDADPGVVTDAASTQAYQSVVQQLQLAVAELEQYHLFAPTTQVHAARAKFNQPNVTLEAILAYVDSITGVGRIVDTTIPPQTPGATTPLQTSIHQAELDLYRGFVTPQQIENTRLNYGSNTNFQVILDQYNAAVVRSTQLQEAQHPPVPSTVVPPPDVEPQLVMTPAELQALQARYGTDARVTDLLEHVTRIETQLAAVPGHQPDNNQWAATQPLDLRPDIERNAHTLTAPIPPEAAAVAANPPPPGEPT